MSPPLHSMSRKELRQLRSSITSRSPQPGDHTLLKDIDRWTEIKELHPQAPLWVYPTIATASLLAAATAIWLLLI